MLTVSCVSPSSAEDVEWYTACIEEGRRRSRRFMAVGVGFQGQCVEGELDPRVCPVSMTDLIRDAALMFTIACAFCHNGRLFADQLNVR